MARQARASVSRLTAEPASARKASGGDVDSAEAGPAATRPWSPRRDSAARRPPTHRGGLDRHGPHQAQDRSLVGEDAHHLGPALDLLDHPPERVRIRYESADVRPTRPAQRPGSGCEPPGRGGVGSTGAGRCWWMGRAPALVDRRACHLPGCARSPRRGRPWSLSRAEAHAPDSHHHARPRGPAGRDAQTLIPTRHGAAGDPPGVVTGDNKTLRDGPGRVAGRPRLHAVAIPDRETRRDSPRLARGCSWPQPSTAHQGWAAVYLWSRPTIGQ
jgi:hypothetical protein